MLRWRMHFHHRFDSMVLPYDSRCVRHLMAENVWEQAGCQVLLIPFLRSCLWRYLVHISCSHCLAHPDLQSLSTATSFYPILPQVNLICLLGCLCWCIVYFLRHSPCSTRRWLGHHFSLKIAGTGCFVDFQMEKSAERLVDLRSSGSYWRHYRCQSCLLLWWSRPEFTKTFVHIE